MTGRAVHRLLRRLLPRSFRVRCGAEMEEVFAEQLEAARGEGLGAVARLWLREAVDLAMTGRRMRRDARRHGAGVVARGARPKRTRGEGRGTMGLGDDLRYAMRSLARRPSLTAFAVATVGLGIGATTAMFSTVESVVLNPVPLESADRLVGLFRRMGDTPAFVTPRSEDVRLWGEQSDIFEAVEPWTMRSLTLTGRGEAQEVEAALVLPSYSGTLGWTPAAGRSFVDEDASGATGNVLILSHSFAVQAFGSAAAALGQALTLDGNPWTVVGVAPRGLLLPGFGLMAVEAWIPMTPQDQQGPTPAVAILRHDVSVEQANQRLAQLAEAAGVTTSRGYARLVTEMASRGIRDYLGLLMGAVVLLLLIACVNVSNLLLFRANDRRRETAVRSALGAGRARITRQMLVESLVLAGAGGILGAALSYVGQAAILRLRPSQLEILDHVSPDVGVWAFAVGVTLAAGLIFGLLPALQSGRADAHSSLRSGVRTHGDVVGGRLRWMMVSAEVALSFALLLASLGVVATLVARQRVDLGFRAEEVAVARIIAPPWKYAEESGETDPLFDDVLARLSRLPGVAHATRASGAPPRAGVLFGTVEIEGGEPLEGTQVLHGPFVRPDYFEVLGQRVLAGRPFTAAELEEGEGVVMLGEETARRFFPDGNAVGSRLRVGGEEWLTVVGVAADVPMTGLSVADRPLQVYHPLRETWSSASFVVRAGTLADPGALLPLMREVIASVDPDLRIDALGTGASMLRDTLERERFATIIMAVFASLALVLAAVGLYGVVSQVVGQRTREIGIRIALGARKHAIASMVLRRVGGATLAGIAVGVVLAWLGGAFLETRVFGFEGMDVRSYVLAGMALGLTALLAAYSPARRATRVDPVEAIRAER